MNTLEDQINLNVLKKAQHGDYYYCVKVPTTISKTGDLFVMADMVEYTPTGIALFVETDPDGVRVVNLALAPGQWIAVYAASTIDGHPVAVEHWEWDELDTIERTSQVIERSRMSQKLRIEIFDRDNNVCQICGRGALDGAKLEVDHIVPVFRGGKTIASNLRTLCFDCNRGKGKR